MPAGWVRVEMLRTLDQAVVVMTLPIGTVVELPPEVVAQYESSGIAKRVTHKSTPALEAAVQAAPSRRG